ncbi:deubiquitinating enzyme [Ceratobasidium sp. 392]|nr:deubiquitinating enzyme [Ceratobasidium sp. 392]
MSAFTVHIKHGGKQQSLQLDPEQPPSIFKEAIYQATGVPVDRMKVMIKGSLLKDDTTWKGVNPKAGQTFMVIGTAGELPKPPSTPIQFLEDMNDSELATALSMPVGLQNLGNTCYMNSTVQALRAIPELQTALDPQKSVEDPEEPEKVTTEGMLKINCNITASTNYMHTGIKDSLDEVIEKHSERLGRTAQYQQTSRISRLPSNLTVHMVRFYWRREINRKAKIMRKVKFPFELDVLDLLTDALREKLQPATRKLREIEGERLERRRARRKLKASSAPTTSNQASTSAPAPAEGGDAMAVDEPRPGDIEDEAIARTREKAALDEVIDPEVKADTGAAVHALFDLAAIVTHKGASADGGHYIGWVRKSALDPAGIQDESAPEGDKEEWYKFDDDKVSVVTREKITTLDGGGEDSTAYILLYRAKNVY